MYQLNRLMKRHFKIILLKLRLKFCFGSDVWEADGLSGGIKSPPFMEPEGSQ